LVFLAITGSLLLGPAARGYESSKLLNGIAAVADVITDLYVTSDPRLTTGSSSSNVIAGLSLPQAPAALVSKIRPEVLLALDNTIAETSH